LRLDNQTAAFTNLNLDQLRVSSLGDALIDFEHIRDLSLDSNQLENIDLLRNFKYLQSLSAQNNVISDIYFMSESAAQLKFLTNANFSGNKLTKLRQIHCRQLLELKVDRNEITEVELKCHDNLQKLSMQKNKLVSLAGFNNLKNLTSLDLAENQIETLNGISGCDKLRSLNLTLNKIEKFTDVPSLPGLESLDLTQCPITDLAEIGHLMAFKNLNSLNLTETPLSEEKGDDLKKEVLILLDGLNITAFNGEEVTEDELEEAKQEKKDRIQAAEEARLEAEREAKEAEEARLEAEREAKEIEDARLAEEKAAK
jgi:Leucine-rich repeat (LRR) protein